METKSCPEAWLLVPAATRQLTLGRASVWKTKALSASLIPSLEMNKTNNVERAGEIDDTADLRLSV